MKVSFSSFTPANIKYTRLDGANQNNKGLLNGTSTTCPSFRNGYFFTQITKSPTKISQLLEQWPELSKIMSVKNEYNLDSKHIQAIINSFKDKPHNEAINKIARIISFKTLAMANKHLLGRAYENITEKDINDLLYNIPHMTSNVLELLGEKTLLHSFKDKLDCVQDYMALIGLTTKSKVITERVKELINPEESEEFKLLETKIRLLKQSFSKNKKKEEQNELINLINDLTRKRNELIENSADDPKDCLNIALIASLLDNEILEVIKFFKNAKLNTKEDLLNFYNFTEKYFYKSIGINEISQRVKKKISLQNNKFLPRIFKSKDNFRNELRDLIRLLERYSDKSNAEIFDKLPQNEETKKTFKKFGIDYYKWCEVDPNSYIEKTHQGETIRVQKIDMYNIPKALFLGDEVSCCTKMGGKENAAAVTYIKNKMFSGIEVLCDGKPICNTMCYIALIEGKPSLILDNIELLPQYRAKTTFEIERGKENYEQHFKIRNLLFEYAQKFVEEIGCPNMPIFMNGTRQRVNTLGYNKKTYKVTLLGNSGNDKVYIDSIGTSFVVDNYTRCLGTGDLYAVNSKAKEIQDNLFVGTRNSFNEQENMSLYFSFDSDEQLYVRGNFDEN